MDDLQGTRTCGCTDGVANSFKIYGVARLEKIMDLGLILVADSSYAL